VAISSSDLISAYIGMRTQKKDAKEKIKSYEKDINSKQQVIIDYFLREAKASGVESFPTESGTAFKALEQYVNIEDKMSFLTFILNELLLAVYLNRYRDETGEWREHGEELLKRDRNVIVDAEVLDFINISPNKANCISYMKEHDGILPNGLKYTAEKTIQFRRPSKRNPK